MSAERIIGVDFGTSTSVIRVKSYENNDYQGKDLDTKEVIFGGMSAMVPTLIQKKNDNESVPFYGFEAQQKKKQSTTYHSFKVDLESSDPDKRTLARQLTEEFFQFMAKNYKAQSEGGHLGKAGEKERTIVSYPVKWSEETRQFMIRAAEKAGFPNVTGMDEAQAAIQAVAVQSTAYLKQHGLLVSGVPSNVLLIDMGAGTTDLVLCRYTVGDKSEIEILNTWPKGGAVLFGGKEVDYLLQGFFRNLMKPEDAEKALKSIGVDQFKTWKETSVSPALSKKDSVTDFYALDNYADIVGIEIDDYKLDRAAFEACLGDYLKQLPKLISGCLQDAGMKGSEVDLVIVTGGHSQWYFVKEMLAGKMTQFGEVGLTKIQNDESRIIPVTRPQETVALGLVYSPIPVKIVEPKPISKSMSKSNSTEDNTNLLDKVSITYDQGLLFVKPDKTIYQDRLKYDKGVLLWKNIRSIYMDGTFVIGLREDGTAVSTGDYLSWYSVNEWGNIRSIVARNSYHAVGLREDGTVVATGKNEEDQCNVSSWNNIRSIACTKYHTVGLREDGTVVVTGDKDSKWQNVCGWRNIRSIVCSHWNVVGLQEDGTVVTTIKSSCNASSWRNICSIACGDSNKYNASAGSHMVGLREDGTVVATGNNEYGQCNVSGWRNIRSIACGDRYTVGLQEDGRVVATGDNEYGQCNVFDWKDIIAIKVENNHTIGIRRDGRIRYTDYKIHVDEKKNWFGKVVDKDVYTEVLPSKITPVSIF